jgi:hypothetical protein
MTFEIFHITTMNNKIMRCMYTGTSIISAKSKIEAIEKYRKDKGLPVLWPAGSKNTWSLSQNRSILIRRHKKAI